MRYFLLLALVAISGCSSFGVSECSKQNWNELGQKDARGGLPVAHFFVRQGLCTGHGDKGSYKKGRTLGLVDYCESKNAFKVGRSGEPYRFICPKKEEKRFLKRYRLGHDIYLLEMEISDRKDKIDDLYERLKYEKDLTDYEKNDLMEEIKTLKNEQKADQLLIDKKLSEAKLSKLIGERE